MKKQFISLFCALTLGLSGCASNTQTNTNVPKNESVKTEAVEKAETYADFLNQLFIEELECDYNTFHTYVQNPDDFGIDRKNVEVSLGEFDSEADEEEIAHDEENLATLKSYDYNSLNDEEKVIYDQIVYTYDLNEKINDDKYKYLECIWSGTSSSTTSLYNLFMEYSFYSEQDIEDCITLINDVPRYMDEVMEYTSKQADKGLLMIDYDNVVKGVNDIIKSKESKNVLNALKKAMDPLKLDSAKKEEYSKKIEEALNDSFYPSYEKVIDGLAEVKDKNKAHVGLGKLKNGQDFYKTLLQYYTGTNDEPEAIRKKLKKVIDDAMTVIYTTFASSDPSTGFKDTKDIMKFLEEHYKEEFPEIKIPDYNVEALSAEQEQDNVVAYYVIPAIDYNGSEKIRYNSHNSRAKASNLEFYQTLAHEGIPGHMYANEFYRENFKYNIHYLLSNLGFSEGYATYVESRSLHFLSMDKDTLKYENAYTVLNNAYTCLMDLSVNYDGLTYKEFQKEYSSLFGSDLEELYNTLCESPGIFMAYYYGYFTIIDLRQEAQKELGDKFDNVEFNTALLKSGDVNFEIIKRSIQDYIQNTK